MIVSLPFPAAWRSVVTPLAVGPRPVIANPTAVVTPKAPPHPQRHSLLDTIHLLDCAVTALTRDAGAHVAAVIEVDEIREVVHLDPLDRPLLQERFAQLLDL